MLHMTDAVDGFSCTPRSPFLLSPVQSDRCTRSIRKSPLGTLIAIYLSKKFMGTFVLPAKVEVLMKVSRQLEAINMFVWLQTTIFLLQLFH